MERRRPDPDGAVDRFARSFLAPRGQTSIMALLEDMTAAINAEFRYAARLEGGAQAPAETLERRTGSCRDFAVLMIDAARSLGLAAQFVSGYLYTPPVTRGSLTRLGGGHTHAWVRVYVPQWGWVEFDPTNGLIASPDLLRVAAARDPSQASPLSGVFQGAGAAFLGLDVEVCVDRLADAEIQAPIPAPAARRAAGGAR
jgi:transglutaminase-like putative cysteine protease